jgi:hypothetical protein
MEIGMIVPTGACAHFVMPGKTSSERSCGKKERIFWQGTPSLVADRLSKDFPIYSDSAPNCVDGQDSGSESLR